MSEQAYLWPDGYYRTTPPDPSSQEHRLLKKRGVNCMATLLEQLPYQLSEGVTATRDGLEFAGDAVYSILYCSGMVPFDQLDPDTHKPLAEDECDEYDKDPIDRVSWSCVAERLRYRDGEPWCAEGRYNGLACGNDHWDELPLEARPLHRLSAILCDDAEAFRVLHWCVTELGQEAGDDV